MEDTPEPVREDAISRLQALGEQCPTIAGWSIGVNIAKSPSAYDIAEVGDFKDIEALNTYKEHPAHQALSAHLGTIATWALVDYEYDL